ncbi:CocE/NonD family hydrolase [Mycolicibacterium sp. Dal123E01]|uniref:CocE/NonD family hydrolase n=1 Tax=Mycolicibacterium sp. Dal123E01 TaxID=3457578 RepID=UPI00403EF3D1
MGSARYVGRVGGLAVALGVGLGIAIGCGTASAAPDSAGSAASHAAASGPATSSKTTAHTARVTPKQVKVAATDAASTKPKAVQQPTAAVQDKAAATTTGIGYTPTVAVDHGVITGTNTAPTTVNGNPVSYTVVHSPADGAKATLNPTTGNFTFLPYATALASGSEQFIVLASETTRFDQALLAIPLLGALLVQPALNQLHQMPILNTVLAPLIGTSTLVPITITPSALNPTGQPIAYTVTVTSFDGTRISTNYFPASGLTSDQSAPTILNSPGAAERGNTDPSQLIAADSASMQELRDAGYNVVTWDPRGEYASTGVLQLDNPQFEGRDVSAIVDYIATLPTTQLDGPGDPRVGMVGGSYGGGIQFNAAAIDTRIDALAPEIAWNNIPQVLAPFAGAVRTTYGLLLALNFALTGTRANPLLYIGTLTAPIFNALLDPVLNFLTSNGPGVLTGRVTVPTLLIQGTVDTMFPLQQAVLNGQMLAANGVAVKMIWFCGGHGTCLTDPGADPNWVGDETLTWMAKYLKGADVDTGATFEWVDQNGNYYSANNLPSDPEFYGGTLTSTGTGGLLPIIPIIGGSGPSKAPSPFNYTDGAPAKNAINIAITNPTQTTEMVGAPTLTMTYSGLATGTGGNAVYAQIVDKKTGLVVGNQVTPVPVTLDGRQHTVEVPLSYIAYTMDADSDLELQIVGSATAWLNYTQYGAINVGNVQLVLPTAADAHQEFPVAIAVYRTQ